MHSNSLRTKQPDADSPATKRGPRPGDFALGGLQSRAAARAIIHRLAEDHGPKPGDIFLNLRFLTIQRTAEIYRALRSFRNARGVSDEPSPRIPGLPKMWLQFPKGFDPNSIPENTPPLTIQNAPDDLLKDVLECGKRAFRKAKHAGKKLPSEFDPDLTWNGMACVPKQTPSKVTR